MHNKEFVNFSSGPLLEEWLELTIGYEISQPVLFFLVVNPGKLIFSHVVKGTKIKITAKLRASRRVRFEDTKRVSPEIRPKSFGTSRKSRRLFGPEKPFVKLRPAHSVKLVFSYVVKGIQIKITAKFRASRFLCFEDTKRTMSPEMRPKSLGTFKKRAPVGQSLVV